MSRKFTRPTLVALLGLGLSLGFTPSAPAADRMVIAEDFTATW
ncbi:MAG: hypothetical protein AB1716_04190 [Planctomycetota bacterium]